MVNKNDQPVSFALSVFIIAHWSIFMMAPFKSLLDNSTISVMLVLAATDYLWSSWDLFSSWYEWFFFHWNLGIMLQDSGSSLNLLFLLASSDTALAGDLVGEDIASSLLCDCRSPGSPSGLCQHSGAGILCYYWGRLRVLASHQASTDTSLAGIGKITLLLLPIWSSLIPCGRGRCPHHL